MGGNESTDFSKTNESNFEIQSNIKDEHYGEAKILGFKNNPEKRFALKSKYCTSQTDFTKIHKYAQKMKELTSKNHQLVKLRDI